MAATDPTSGRVLETPELRERGLQMMRALLEKHADARCVRTDDTFLLPFLRKNKYDIQRSYRTFSRFNDFWFSHPGIINGLCAQTVRPIIETQFTQYCKGTDVFGNRVVVLYMKNLDKATAADQLALAIYTMPELFADEEMSLCGVTYVVSLTGFTLKSLWKLRQLVLSKENRTLLALPVDRIPLRVRAICVIDAPVFYSWAYKFVRPFLSAKLRERVKLITREALLAVVPAATLPIDCGGTAASDFTWQIGGLTFIPYAPSPELTPDACRIKTFKLQCFLAYTRRW